MAALVRPPSYLSYRSPEDHRAGRGVGDGWWVVGRVAIVVATSLPPPTESTTNALPPSFLTLRRFPGGDSPATSASFLSLQGTTGTGGGVVGGAVPRSGRGWGVILGDVWGGWRHSIPLTPPSFLSLP